MRTIVAAAIIGAAFSMPSVAGADAPPQPRIEFTVYDTTTELRSMSGDLLDLTFDWQGHNLYVRSYSEEAMVEDVQLDAPDAPLRGHAMHGAGYASVTVEHLMGNLHGLAGFTAPTVDWATSDFMYGGNVVLTLPARSVLTMTGRIEVKAAAEHEKNYMYFERGLVASAEGTYANGFVLDTVAPQDSFSITAVNPLDAEATFYYYTAMNGTAFSVIAVPEPSSAAMASGGLLLLAALIGRSRRSGRRAGIPGTAQAYAAFVRRSWSRGWKGSPLWTSRPCRFAHRSGIMRG